MPRLVSEFPGYALNRRLYSLLKVVKLGIRLDEQIILTITGNSS
jgi:hypothetical protein